ncbi:metallophosphoesterase [Candidatus Woesearchaeota archaeon]|jgi:uncharacterized protein|nr:metallophosphoesterase [Candidatus Woesearchaeota archaeon]MBT6519356.1 metallophosphoesterase [Candidatus Woesearchaeota archaeon]MBT7366817.1 metallophosphoesterase [Candidatus Woesearchaeota archaeon]
MMLINKSIQIIDLGLWLPKSRTLVIADLHIGLEDALNKQGVLIPKFHFKDLTDRLEKIINYIQVELKQKIKLIVVNGDIKHEFGTISDEEWRNTLKVIDYLSLKSEKLILIKGNHDTILGPIAEKRKIDVVDYYVSEVESILVVHGDKPIKQKIKKIESNSIKVDSKFVKIKTVIMGHEHTAVLIGDETRKETYKCFLVGKYKLSNLRKINLIAMPSMNQLSQGTDVTKESLLSPLLNGKEVNLRNFDVYVVADNSENVYGFGKLKKLI